MSLTPAGSRVAYRVTYLEMRARPDWAMPRLPEHIRLERAIDPPVWYFLSLYDAVGRDYEWQDRFVQAEEDPAALQSFVRDPDVVIWTAMGHGWPQGFFMLDWSMPRVCDLAYFGLVPQAVGKGWGKALLKTAILTGWAREGVERMTVNTCTLDHPRALSLYQQLGFRAVSTEDRARVLVHDHDPSRFP